MMFSRTRIADSRSALMAGSISALCVFFASPAIPRNDAQERAFLIQQDCDRLAGSPYDDRRNPVFEPVRMGEIAGAAADSCRMAYEATGNARFAYQLGRVLNKNNEVSGAMDAYTLAVKDNYPAAMVNFGVLLGRLGDSKAEFAMFLKAAEKGNTLAAYNVGVAYRDGEGAAANAVLALKWFEAAVKAGDHGAAFNIAMMYDEGQLVTQDNATAIAWYDMAASMGNSSAMINLGVMLQTGEGIAINNDEAARMYERAAVLGDPMGVEKLKGMQQGGLYPPPQAKADRQVPMETLELRAGEANIPAGAPQDI